MTSQCALRLDKNWHAGRKFRSRKDGFPLEKAVASYVPDTSFMADLTIVEEASELPERVTKGTRPLPQFTGGCPSWVKYAQSYFEIRKENY